MKKTRIVATIGPASDNKEVLSELIKNGVNVCRINFSHGTHESNGKVFEIIKELREELKRPIGILADLQGPRVRIAIDKELEIKEGEIIRVSDPKSFPNFQNPISNFQINPNDPISKIFFVDNDNVIDGIEVGNEILIEDGLKKVKVIKKEKEFLEAEVIAGGIIKNHKGVNIPDAKFNFGAVTEKDAKDLEFAVKSGATFVALSFVSNAQEILETREKMKKILGREDNLPQIVSKIERKEAIKNLDEIIEASDIIMVARGDLGIELEESKVVLYQKEIIKKCLQSAKPVIVATQMMDSMIENPIPTRAEVSDVSNAVIDHTDAVMLSGESANGKYPVKTVAMMNKIVTDTEESPFDDIDVCTFNQDLMTDYISIINGACSLARNSKAKAIILFTQSGYTARMMSNHRLEKLLIVATNNPQTYNQLSIVWGARAYLLKEEDNEKFVDLILEKCKNENKLKVGDQVVVIKGRKDKNKLPTIGMTQVK